MEEIESRLRVLLVCQRYQLEPAHSQYHPLHDAFQHRFGLTRWYVEDGWPATIDDFEGYERYDAVIWFVRFRELLHQPAFRWGPYRGLRLMYDQDANQDFSRVGGARYFGKWPAVFKRNEFHLLACTGAKTRDHLISKGVRAVWVPKAVEEGRFGDLGDSRSGVCIYGSRYPARTAMEATLGSHGVAYERFRCSYTELNAHLNRFEGGLVCNMESTFRGGRFGAILNRWRPGMALRLSEGPEMMLKNFEIPAAGCVCFCDYIPEMAELGFVDGETAVTYASFAELVEKLRYYLPRPDETRRIGARGAALCAERHTWDHRMEQIERLIRKGTSNQ